ncbi:tetratricopeptide repeat protein [archaeon]|nr:MAG: tetratricopeptide repeat protein [archaeon]
MREIGSSYPALTVLKLTCLFNLNRPEEAFNLSNTLLRNRSAFSSDSKVLLLRAQCLFSMGDLENSVKHCQQALRGDPDNSSVRSYYKSVKEVVERKAGGDSDYKEGQFQSAVAQYTVCIDTILGMQGLNVVYVAKILLNRGVCRHKLKKHEEAVKDFNKALYYHKTYAKAVVKRGDCFLAMGGVENIQKAIK